MREVHFMMVIMIKLDHVITCNRDMRFTFNQAYIYMIDISGVIIQDDRTNELKKKKKKMRDKNREQATCNGS